MSSFSVYRISFYVMMAIATTALCLDSSETTFGIYYPAIVSAFGAACFYMVDRNPRWELPRWVVNLLGLSTLILPYFEYNSDENPMMMIRATGHWLILLQLVMYVLPKTAREDWFLFGLGLLEVLIGSMINESDQVGIWLFLWAMSAVWVLNLFFLQREARRFVSDPAGMEGSTSLFNRRKSPRLGPLSVDPYRGLVDTPFVFETIKVMLAALTLGGLIFLFMPRQVGAARNRAGTTSTKHLTGFGEEVQLGQLGEILENDSVVMIVEFLDESEKQTQPKTEPLWRGSTMAQYENGKWHRQRQQPGGLPVYKSSEELRRHELRQNIHLEPNDSSSLFGIRPIVQIAAAGGRLPPYINVIDGTISRPEVRSGSYEAYDYTVVSDLDSEKPQGSEDPPNLIRLELLLNIPDELAMRLRQIAEPIVADIKTPGPKGIEEKARKLEEFLRDSGQFGYTLQMDMVNPSLDPVEDFLVNRKEGHCEYFASALALLLRSIDIPSRVVNGFKGGDWNDVTQAMYVRQKHAHSWVEAYLGSSDKRTANWITLDPTPGLARQQSVAEVGGFSSNFRTLSDTIRHIWVFYILGFDANRQNRLVYEPMRAAAKELKRLYLELDLTVRAYAQQLFGFENLDSLISIRGFFVSFIVLTTLMLLIRALIWLYGRLLGIFRDPAADSPSVVAGILFYRRLVQILTKFEIEREPAETQQEFARRAAFFLGARGPETESVAAVPGLIVDAFYRVRFGHLDLSEKTLEMLEERLDALDQTLKTD